MVIPRNQNSQPIGENLEDRRRVGRAGSPSSRPPPRSASENIEDRRRVGVGGRIKPRKFEPAGSHLGFEQRDNLAASRRQKLSPSMVMILAWWTTSRGHAA